MKNLVVGGINYSDFSDFCDIFAEYAEHEDGTPYTDEELDAIPHEVLYEAISSDSLFA